MELEPDRRKFSDIEDRYVQCVNCGAELVMLPADKRGGYCFDCLHLKGEPGSQLTES